MLVIFKKEIKTYFTTMTGYIFLGFLVLLTGIFFSMINLASMNPNYTNTLSNTAILFLILIPTLTMRLFADETRQKTDQLIFTSPISVTQIVLGKFLSAFVLFAFGLAITMIFPFIISQFGELPLPATIGAVVGYLFLASAFISVGLFVSSLTESQVISAVGTFAALFIFYIMDMLAQSMPTDRVSSIVFLAAIAIVMAFIMYDSTKSIITGLVLALICFGIIAIMYFVNPILLDGVIYKVFMWFSLLARFDQFGLGIFSLGDIVYYLTFSLAFIYLTVHVIEKRRV